MANKMNVLKLLQEMRGFAEMSNRRAQPRAGLLIMQLRNHLLQTTAGKRKRVISIAMQQCPDIPHPVKITHVATASAPAPGNPSSNAPEA